MKKVGSFLCFIILCASPAFAKQCFIVKEKDKIIHQEGDCDQRYAPCSTFKIALSLIGYDLGILVDEMNPSWPFKKILGVKVMRIVKMRMRKRDRRLRMAVHNIGSSGINNSPVE